MKKYIITIILVCLAEIIMFGMRYNPTILERLLIATSVASLVNVTFRR